MNNGNGLSQDSTCSILEQAANNEKRFVVSHSTRWF